jgi:uncharacterized protein
MLKRRYSVAWLMAGGVLPAMAAPIDDLVTAAEFNDTRVIARLLATGLDPNLPDGRGRTAIFTALREGATEAVSALLASPLLDPNLVNPSGETPLMMAAIRANLPAARALVKRGAAVNRAGWTPLHYAASGPDLGVSAFLIGQGAEVNARSPNGTTPLMMSARYGSSEVTPMLLKAGADASLKNELGLTAADFARQSGRDRDAAELARLAAQPR